MINEYHESYMDAGDGTTPLSLMTMKRYDPYDVDIRGE